ncbi:MAG: hypothetical protein IIA67_10065 [Planctomycetes bacterium]|nr:hypothetical protein [Planctomycetota bacterium]
MRWHPTSRVGRVMGRIALSIPLLFSAVASVQLAAGAMLLWRHFSHAPAGSMQALTGVLLIAAATVGLLVIYRRWCRPADQKNTVRFRKRLYWRWLAVGFIGCYAICLMLGPDPSRQNAFWTAVAWWHTALLWSLAAPPQRLARLTTFLKRRPLLGVGWTAYALVMVVLFGELGLRVYALAIGDRPADRYIARGQTLPPGSQIRGRRVNTQGYWDDEFQTARVPGRLRIAVLGDEMTLSGDAQSNCLDQIERLNRGVDVYNFGLPGVGPREYAAQATGEVARYEPQLVMLFISVGDDITSQLPTPGVFDWRGLHLYQAGARLFSDSRSAGRLPKELAVEQPPSSPSDRGDYLRRCAGRLSVCRTPLSSRMRRRWQEVEAHLQHVAQACRSRDVPLLIVVVPADFQVNPVLCDSMRRQMGYQSEQVDLELPQRRLREFAEVHDVLLLDLLPEFKADGAKLYLRHQSRWSKRGNTKAARLIDAWLRSRYPTGGERLARAGR